MPASWASAGVGYQHITQGIELEWIRAVAGRYAACTALMRSAAMSLPSRVFSGAEIAISPSQCSNACASIAAGSASTSSGAWRTQSRW